MATKNHEKKLGRPKRSKRESAVARIQCKMLAEQLANELELEPSGYELGNHLHQYKLSSRDLDSEIRIWNLRLAGETGLPRPRELLLLRRIAPRSLALLDFPLWSILGAGSLSASEVEIRLRQIDPSITAQLVGSKGLQSLKKLERKAERTLSKLGTLDAFTALMALSKYGECTPNQAAAFAVFAFNVFLRAMAFYRFGEIAYEIRAVAFEHLLTKPYKTGHYQSLVIRALELHLDYAILRNYLLLNVHKERFPRHYSENSIFKHIELADKVRTRWVRKWILAIGTDDPRRIHFVNWKTSPSFWWAAPEYLPDWHIPPPRFLLPTEAYKAIEQRLRWGGDSPATNARLADIDLKL